MIDVRPGRASRQEIVDLYESLPRRGPAQLLGVPLNAEPASALVAFRGLARRFHPDALGPANADLRGQAQAIFIELERACRHFGGHRAASAPPVTTQATTRPAEPVASAALALPEPVAAVAPAPSGAVTLPTRPEADIRRARLEDALDAAQSAIGRDDTETAVALLHEVMRLAQDHDRRRVRLLLARAYLADNRWRRYALALLREMTDGPTPDAQALALLGGLYHREGLLARAESTLVRALSIDPAEREALRELQGVRERLAERRPVSSGRARRPGLVKRLLMVAR